MFISDRGIDPLARKIIRQKAHQLAGKGSFSHSDIPDIEQELLLKLFRCQGAYDASRGRPSTFIKTVAERQAMNLLRDRRSRGRASVRLSRLECVEDVESHDSGKLPQELGWDVQDALQRLDADDWRLCRCLMHQTFSQAARTLGVPRSTLQDRVRRLSQKLRALGLADYATVARRQSDEKPGK